MKNLNSIPREINLRQAILLGKDISNANLCDADLQNTNLIGYDFINKDLLKVTSEHEFWVLNKNVEPENEYMPPIDRWGFKKAASLKVGDVLFGKNELIEIESIEWNHTEVEVVNINVEPVDVYFVNNILVHNKGNDNQH